MFIEKQFSGHCGTYFVVRGKYTCSGPGYLGSVYGEMKQDNSDVPLFLASVDSRQMN